MATCKDEIKRLQKLNSKQNPFIGFNEISFIANNNIHYFETDTRFYMIIHDMWDYEFSWFPKNCKFRSLNDGLEFWVVKNEVYEMREITN